MERLTRDLAERYRIERELGRGGMATVYLAEDVKHGRLVAIKVLRPELAASLATTRFLREIEIAARLRHPHILPLYDSGEAADSLLYVMPYVAGESLRERLEREQQLPLADACRIAAEVADALAYAHAHDVVHRDIKPENILLESGHAVVADFGVARAVTAAQDEQLTGTGLAVGTPVYMSPEQGAADDRVDGRADVYALGCVLYEMLAGEPPFSGPSVQAILARHAAAPVPRLRTIRHAVPDWLDDVIATALAKVPADRFATAAEFRDVLATPAAARVVAERTAAPYQGNAIVVLPFANLSGDPGDEFLSDGISEELIHALAKLESVRVVARTSAFAFKGRHEDVRVIAKRLNVSTVLEGSVRRAGTRVRIAAQLVNAADGYELWSDRYDRELDDVLAIQDEIAQTIAQVLKPRLTSAAREARWVGRETSGTAAPHPGGAPAAADPEAHRLYLKGRHHWNRRTETGILRAIECFGEAAELERGYAPAHAGMADAHVTLGIYGLMAPEEAMPRAKAAALCALELDGRLPEALASLASVRAMYEWDWAGADRDFRSAVEAGPNAAMAHHWYAMHLLIPLARLAEAEHALERARELDPLSPAINASLAIRLYFAREHDRAGAALAEALELDPGFGAAHLFRGQVLVQQGRHDDAIAALRDATRLSDSSAETVAMLGHALAVAGRRTEAEELLAELTSRAARSYVSPTLLAHVALGLGDVAGALDHLERAVERRAADLVWLKVRPTFDPLRTEHRFAALLERMGFP